MPDAVTISGIPTPLTWGLSPAAWASTPTGVEITAGPRTDMFVDPAGGAPTVNAPRLTMPADGDFQLSAKVTVGFAATYDAGVLLLFAGDTQWAKLCFELSPQAKPMIVSVVTRGVSDDANAFAVEGDTAWLRVSRTGRAYAFHASADGGFWHFIRYFTLDEPAAVGFEAQSPTGQGCAAAFSEVTFKPEGLAELRDGS